MAYTDIDKPSDYFNTVLYSGTDSAQAVTGVGFQPDWTWIKCRSHGGSASFEHILTDAVRGVNKTLVSNDTDAETTDNATGYLNIFGSDGFTTASGGTSIDAVGGAGRTYASWNWKETATAGFDIVSYSGTGSTATVSHNLGVVPSLIILKCRTNANPDWIVFGKALGGTVGSEFLKLNNTTAKTTGLNTSWFNQTAPTSSVFTVGTQLDVNASSNTYIAYCFAEKQGYLKTGKWTGNGNNDGPFSFCGFKPAFIMIKRTDVAKNWYINDNLREGYNNDNPYLSPNISAAETGGTEIDILSNGFKIRASGTGHNQSGGTYIYMAIAENPFVTSTGVPACAR